MKKSTFLIIFLAAMIPTYFVRYYLMKEGFSDAYNDQVTMTYDQMQDFINFGLGICYAIMSYVAYKFGETIDKSYLFVFPLVGAIFDLFLVYIPFVPTIMSIIALVVVVVSPDSKKEVAVS